MRLLKYKNMAQFYRKGVDIYNADNNQKIGATDWQKNWTGRATEVKAPADPFSGDVKFTLNPDYNPNDPNVNRYIPIGVVANSTPATLGLPKASDKGGVSVIEPLAGQNPTVSVV